MGNKSKNLALAMAVLTGLSAGKNNLVDASTNKMPQNASTSISSSVSQNMSSSATESQDIILDEETSKMLIKMLVEMMKTVIKLKQQIESEKVYLVDFLGIKEDMKMFQKELKETYKADGDYYDWVEQDAVSNIESSLAATIYLVAPSFDVDNSSTEDLINVDLDSLPFDKIHPKDYREIANLMDRLLRLNTPSYKFLGEGYVMKLLNEYGINYDPKYIESGILEFRIKYNVMEEIEEEYEAKSTINPSNELSAPKRVRA